MGSLARSLAFSPRLPIIGAWSDAISFLVIFVNFLAHSEAKGVVDLRRIVFSFDSAHADKAPCSWAVLVAFLFIPSLLLLPSVLPPLLFGLIVLSGPLLAAHCRIVLTQ